MLFKFTLFFLIIVFSPTLCLPQPSIMGVGGIISDGEQVTIFGEEFGLSGPEIRLFDSFQGGEPGQNLSLQADIGIWDEFSNTGHPIFVSDDNLGSGNIAAQMVDGVSLRGKIRFAPTREFYLSYRVKIPDGYHFPNAWAEETFSSTSAWKVVWIMDGNYGYRANDDYCLPTWGNSVYWSIAGNDNASQTRIGSNDDGTQWFEWDVWNRFSVYMKAGDDPVNDNGIIWAQGMGPTHGQEDTLRLDTPVFDGDDNATDDGIFQWSQLNVPGWVKAEDNPPEGTDELSRAYYDDIYFAVGENARARVEIGNNVDYNRCTVLSVLAPGSWSNTQISAMLQVNAFSAADTLYLFVVNKFGEVSLGFGPLLLGQEAPPSRPPYISISN